MQELDVFKKPFEEGREGVDYYAIEKYHQQQYLNYSVSVIIDRAIPDVRDGLKPVHRRILFAMNVLGMSPSTPYKKSARVVGDVIGKYHPHGDTAAYESLVRLSQDFSMRYPVIEGQGNFGSLDGDSPAAMRYTECRLDKFSGLFLKEANPDTVDFIPNYDGSELMPEVLPARIPAALVMSNMGIAVGFKTDILPHNISEAIDASIALFKNPAASTKDLRKHILGPDFPLGGHVISPKDVIDELYETGKANLRTRARWNVEKLAGNDWQICIYELPYGVSTEKVLNEINGLINPDLPKPAGKNKLLSRDDKDKKQKMLLKRQKILSLIDGDQTGDQSGSDTGPIHIIVTPKSKRQDPAALMSYLLAHTSLEVTTRAQMNYINSDGRPEQMGLLRVLQEWNSFRFEVVRKRTQARLDKVNSRVHILEGRHIVILDIQKVADIVITSDSPDHAKSRIIEEFFLSEIQAIDILKTPLGRLTKMDRISLEKEISELRLEREELSTLLSNKDKMVALIIEELLHDKGLFGDDRRTLLEEVSCTTADNTEILSDHPITVILSSRGWIRTRNGHDNDIPALSFKDGDELFRCIKTKTSVPLILFDTSGRAYTINIADIPGGKGDGIPVFSLVDNQSNAKMIDFFSANKGGKVLLTSDDARGFIADCEKMIGRNRAGKVVMKPSENAKILPIHRITNETKLVFSVTNSGYITIFNISEINEYPSAQGMMLQKLKPGESIALNGIGSNEISLPKKSGQTVLKDGKLKNYLRKRASRGRLVPSGVYL